MDEMLRGSYRIGLWRRSPHRPVEVFLCYRGADGETFEIVMGLNGEPMLQRSSLAEESTPLCRIGEMEAQRLADQLYALGIRPAEAAGSIGALDATQAHLQDMRKLVFDGAAVRPPSGA